MAMNSCKPLHGTISKPYSSIQASRFQAIPSTGSYEKTLRGQPSSSTTVGFLVYVAVGGYFGLRQKQNRLLRRALKPLPDFDSLRDLQKSPLRFAQQANWVAPGHILVGRYPITSDDQLGGQDLVRRMVSEAAISTFICFQKEVPSQLEIARWPRQGLELHGRKLLPYAKVAQQFSQGRKLDFVHEPLEDLETPGRDSLTRLVSELESRVRDNNEVLYLHCWGGRGRSATVSACLLGKLYDLTGEEALERIQLGYDSRKYDNSSSPETQRQKQLVLEFLRSGPLLTIKPNQLGAVQPKRTNSTGVEVCYMNMLSTRALV